MSFKERLASFVNFSQESTVRKIEARKYKENVGSQDFLVISPENSMLSSAWQRGKSERTFSGSSQNFSFQKEVN